MPEIISEMGDMDLVINDSRIRNRKSRFFPRIEKNRNLDFMTSLCVDFYWRGIHLYWSW